MGIIAVAAALVLAAPRAAGARDYELVALDGANTLLRFDSARPGDVIAVKVRGVAGTLVGIDHRPSSGVLYGLSTTNDVYTIDRASGAATLVSTLTIAFDAGARSGFDFNPQTDRLRLVGANGQNLRVNVDLGAVAADAPLRYAPTDPNAGKRPAIAAAAYGNAVPNAPVTKLFDIDAELDVLALQDPPNDGVLTTVGPLGVDFGPLAGFDIVSEQGRDRAFAVSGGALYEIDLASGRAHPLGTVGGAADGGLVGLTVVPASDPGRPAYP
ncbi:MAG TPA: DUF4394 domain-containing protein [Candidatus Binatia bacterium]